MKSSRVTDRWLQKISADSKAMKYVKNKAEELKKKQPNLDKSQAYALAWSIYCKYKQEEIPDSESHCKREPAGYFKRTSTMSSLRKKAIHLAYEKPELRAKLLPLLKGAKKVHEKQFEDAKLLSKVDPALAKVITMSGDKNNDKISVGKYSGGASNLNPSQTELIVGKSLGQAIAMLDGKMPLKGDLGAVISSDNHIMDGHHRWAARILAKGKDATVTGFQAKLPGEKLVRILNILTKGAFGRNQGNKGKGNIKEFTPAKVEKTLKGFVEKGIPGEFPWSPDQVKSVLEKNFGSVEEGIETMSKNAKLVKKSVPSWAVARQDMPVINEKDLPKTKKLMEKGEIDWTKPYKEAALRAQVIKLAHRKPELRGKLLPLLKKSKVKVKEPSNAEKILWNQRAEKIEEIMAAGAKYETFVNDLKKFSKDPKYQAVIKAGLEDGEAGEDKISISGGSTKAKKLSPTQNEIDIKKSLIWPLTDKSTITKILAGNVMLGYPTPEPIVIFDGKWVIDGHHRWSQVYCIGPDIALKSDNLKISGFGPAQALKAVQMGIAATIGKIPTQAAPGTNLLKASENQVRDFVIKNLKEDLIPIYEKGGLGKTRDEIADSIWKNVQVMQKNSQPMSGASKRDFMPQTDQAPGWDKELESGDVNLKGPFVPPKFRLGALRSQVIKLAHQKPELRKHLLPLLKKAKTAKEKYPWDECIKDQMKQYGDKETAEKVCGKIKAQSQGKKASLRSQVIKLAHQKPELRKHLLPLIAGGKTAGRPHTRLKNIRQMEQMTGPLRMVQDQSTYPDALYKHGDVWFTDGYHKLYAYTPKSGREFATMIRYVDTDAGSRRFLSPSQNVEKWPSERIDNADFLRRPQPPQHTWLS